MVELPIVAFSECTVVSLSIVRGTSPLFGIFFTCFKMTLTLIHIIHIIRIDIHINTVLSSHVHNNTRIPAQISIRRCHFIVDRTLPIPALFLFYNVGIYLEAQQIQYLCLCCAIGKCFIHTFCRVYILQEHRVLRSYAQAFLFDYNF